LDEQITDALQSIQIDPPHLPVLKTVYEAEIKHIQRMPANELERLRMALVAVDQEEMRGLRLYTTGKAFTG